MEVNLNEIRGVSIAVDIDKYLSTKSGKVVSSTWTITEVFIGYFFENSKVFQKVSDRYIF